MIYYNILRCQRYRGKHIGALAPHPYVGASARGWGAFSAAGLTGQGSPTRSVFSQTPVSLLKEEILVGASARGRFRAMGRPLRRGSPCYDFRGFDSSGILILRGGIPSPIGNFPESLSQAILVGVILVGRLGVRAARGRVSGASPFFAGDVGAFVERRTASQGTVPTPRLASPRLASPRHAMPCHPMPTPYRTVPSCVTRLQSHPLVHGSRHRIASSCGGCGRGRIPSRMRAFQRLCSRAGRQPFSVSRRVT